MKKYENKCPVCHELFSRFKVFDVNVDQCPTCHGLWFNADELESVKDGMAEDVRWKDLDLRAYAEHAHFKHTQHHCPSCASALCELHFGSAHIGLEFCAKCGGTWMAREKLVPIINALRKQMAQEPLARMEKETLHQFVEIFTGHKGPWGELKDFMAAWRMLSLRFMVDHPQLATRLETARRALPF